MNQAGMPSFAGLLVVAYSTGGTPGTRLVCDHALVTASDAQTTAVPAIRTRLPTLPLLYFFPKDSPN